MAGANNDLPFSASQLPPYGRRRRCAWCAYRLPRRGKPGLYCCRPCRRAHEREDAPARGPRTRAATPYEAHPAAVLLRAAIDRYDGTLRDLAGELAAEGAARSAASLSAYQRGVAPLPPGPWLYTLDRVLGEESGTFRAALGPTTAPSAREPAFDAETAALYEKLRPYGRSDTYVVTAVRDDVYVDTQGRPERVAVALTVQADEDDLSSCWILVSTDTAGARSDVTAAEHCKVGRKILLDAECTAFELVFDPKLTAGQRHRIRFTLRHHYPGPAKPFHRRCVPGHWIGDLIIRVHFAKQPRLAWQSEWPLRSAPPRHGRPADTAGGIVHMHRPNPATGTYGVDWLM
jgi:hypothetical protein